MGENPWDVKRWKYVEPGVRFGWHEAWTSTADGRHHPVDTSGLFRPDAFKNTRPGLCRLVVLNNGQRIRVIRKFKEFEDG